MYQGYFWIFSQTADLLAPAASGGDSPFITCLSAELSSLFVQNAKVSN